MIAWGFILVGCLAWLGAAQPIDTDVDDQWLVRERRSVRPERTFNPHMAMGAFAAGSTMGDGSFNGSPSKKLESQDCNKSAPEEEKSSPETSQEEELSAEEEINKSPAVPDRKGKASKVPKRRQAVDEPEVENDDEEDSVARKGDGKPGGAVYRDFFPMTFGGAGASRSRDADDGEEAGAGGNKGSVMAIANSFSKGRGAVASSSAVAHGNPEASQNRENSQSEPSRYRARP